MPNSEIITSRKNPGILHVATLLRDTSLRRREKKTVAEGVKLCREANAAGLLHELYITPDCLQKNPEFISDNLTLVMPHVYERMTLLKSPEGVCAVCRFDDKEFIPKPKGRYLVLCDIQNPDNAGAMIRTAAAFGFDGVIACDGVDMTSPKLLRASAGAAFHIPKYELAKEKTFEMFFDTDIKKVATSPSAPIKLDDCCAPNGVAIFIGNEGNGLDKQVVEQCDEAVRIDLVGLESLNAAVSAGIIMHHFTVKG